MEAKLEQTSRGIRRLTTYRLTLQEIRERLLERSGQEYCHYKDPDGLGLRR